MSKLRGALGIGIAVGAATIASTLLYFFYVERKKRRLSSQEVDSSASRTVFEKVNDGTKGKPLRVKVSRSTSDRKKRSKKHKKKSGDSKRDKESLRGKPLVIATNLVSCDCRTGKNSELDPADTDALEIEEANADLLIPQIHPIAFEQYKPLDLMKMTLEDEKENMSLAALKERNPVKTNVLTPFRPTLNAIAYGHKHTKLIRELLDNYHYLE